MKKIISALLIFLLCVCAFAAAALAAQPDSAWIEERLRALEEQYNAGIMPISFVQGYIPWDEYFTVSGLPASILSDEEYTNGTTVEEKWLNDCKTQDTLSPRGYNVDNTGVKYTKFPQYLEKGVHFNNVTVNGVEVVRAGILVPDNDPDGKPVYYYLTQKHVDSDSNDGSGSHTGSISALILPENAKFKVNYAVNEYKLSYEVQLDGQDVTNVLSPVKDLNGNAVTWEYAIFAGQNPASTNNGEASFTVTIPYGYTAQVYQRFKDGNGNFGAEQELTGPRTDGHEVNDGFALGKEPEYEYYKEDIDGDGRNEEGVRVKLGTDGKLTGPTAKRMSAVFYSDLVQQNRHIIVKLTTFTDRPYFDANAWVHTEYAYERGTAGHDGGWYYHPTGGGNGNIETYDTWHWYNNNYKSVTQLPMDDAGDGTYNYTFTFQTNGGGFILDSLELNGVDLMIPFTPATTSADQDGIRNNEEVIHKAGAYTVTTLPDGATAELRYVRSFGNQQVYTLIITGARSNVTVTGGNLNMLGGAPEFIPSTLVGVTADEANEATIEVYRSTNPPKWERMTLSEPVIDQGSTPLGYDGNGFSVRFKLIDGYEDPVFSWTNPRKGDAVLAGSSLVREGEPRVVPMSELSGIPNKNLIYKDADGYYYIRLDPFPNDKSGYDYKILSLSITASAMKYMVRYMVGKQHDDGLTNVPLDSNVYEDSMPTFDTDDSAWDDGLSKGIAGNYPERYDDNSGNFYDLQSTPIIPINDRMPTTKDETKFFQYWVLVDESEDIVYRNGMPVVVNPGGSINLSQFVDDAVELSKDIGGDEINYYVIRLKGVWSDLPTDFQFYIRMVWTDEETGKSHVMDLVQNVTTSSTDQNLIKNDRLVVTVNTVTDTFKNWFALHPFYAYATRNFIPTLERKGDWLKDGSGNVIFDDDNIPWEAYPVDFTTGSAEQGVKDPNAYYRVVKEGEIVKYEVQRNGTIVLYLEPVNGRLPIAKSITGSDDGADTFTYKITGRLLQEDIDRNLTPGADNYLTEESLQNMLPSGTLFGIAPDATMTDLLDYTGKGIDLHFKRYADGGNMTQWYSTATFTLKGGEATVLGLPQGSYTIEEVNTDASSDFKYDVTVTANGVTTEGPIAQQDVRIGSVTPAVRFSNAVKAIDDPPYTLKISKTIKGMNGATVPSDAQSAEFSFKLELTGGDDTQVVMPDVNTTSITTEADGTGSSEFGAISFYHTGVYTFLVTETVYDAENYFPNPRAHSVTVTVENDNGQLMVAKVAVDKTVYQGNDLENAIVNFTNTYIGDIQEAYVLPEVTKQLLGRSTLPAGMFTFELAAGQNPNDGMILPENTTATNGNGADGSVVFEPVRFTQAGVYTVTVSEQNEGMDGIDYDTNAVTITYTVTQGANGLEVTDTAYSGGAGDKGDTFVNQAYVDAGFNVRKNYNVNQRPGVAWDGDTFKVTATLIQAAGDVLCGTQALALNGAVSLLLTQDAQTKPFEFRFYNEGVYVFEVREENNEIPGVTYDNSIYHVTVRVTANGEVLTPMVSIAKGGVTQSGNTITFYNTFSDKIDVTVQAKKILEDGTLSDRQFNFVLLKMPNGVDVVAGATQAFGSNDINGNVVFTIPSLGHGEYISIMREVNGGRGDITYDNTEYKVEVLVEDKGSGPSASVQYSVRNANGGWTPLTGGRIPTFTNRVNSFGQLVVSNTVTGEGADLNKEFTYTFNFDGRNDALRYELQSAPATKGLFGRFVMPLFAPDSTAVTGTIRSGESIQLRDGQSVTIFGLPFGTGYQVIESDYAGYTVSHDGIAGVTASGTINDTVAQVNYHNRYDPGKVDVTVRAHKELVGAALTAGRFRFALRPKGTQTGGLIAANDASGEVTFTIPELGVGTYAYTLSELDAGESGIVYDQNQYEVTVRVELQPGDAVASYTVEYALDGKTVDAAAFYNAFESPREEDPVLGDLVVSKTVAGEGGDQQKGFSFRVELSDAGIQGDYGAMRFVNGVAAFDLKHGESITATGLTAGVAYTVTETNSEGYEVQSYGETGTILANAVVNARFVNTKIEEEWIDSVPQTGDNSRIALWMALMLMSIAAMCACAFAMKKSAV